MNQTLLVILLSIPGLAFAAEDVVDLPENPELITIQTATSGPSTETVAGVWANYPQLRDKIKAEEAKKLAVEDELSAQKRFALLAAHKIDLPKAASDKHKARIEKFRKDKEAALKRVIKTDAKMPAEEAMLRALRANAKLEEYLGAGISISKETQKAVRAAIPAPSATPTPAPTPNDGL